MIRETVGHLRDLPRYRQILSSLVRYGYQDVVAALHLEGIVRPFERVALGSDVPPQDRPRRLRLVCEDLGPIFVKLGQLLSTRPDLLPEAYTHELAFLRDDVRPFPFEQAETILRQEYARPLPEIFAIIEPVPVASASISQVHRATLLDGRVVALKIRRPDIAKVVQADLDVIKNLAQLVERRLPNLAAYRPVGLAREFERTIKREIDFTFERRTIQRCRAQFEKDPTAHIPAVFEEISTPRIIAMEFIEGVAINDLDGIRRLRSCPKRLRSPARESCSSRSSSSASFTPIPIRATSASCQAESSHRSIMECSDNSKAGRESASPISWPGSSPRIRTACCAPRFTRHPGKADRLARLPP